MAIYGNLFIDQGTTFSATIFVTDSNGDSLDLTGFTAKSQIRKTFSSNNFTEFQTSIPVPTNGEIILSLDAETSGTLKSGRFVYDVKLINDNTNEISRVVEGQVEVNPQVTKHEN